MPLLLLYRLVSQYAGDLAQAERMLRCSRRTIGNNVLLASGPEDDARVFELSPHDVQARAPRDGVLTTTNHFVHESMAARQNGWVVPNSLNRFARLDALCGAARFNPELAAAVLRDSESPADEGDPWSCLENPGTIYSSVAEPSSGRLWLRTNDQPDRPFVELTASWSTQAALSAV